MSDVQTYGLVVLLLTAGFALYSILVSIPDAKQQVDTPWIQLLWRCWAAVIAVLAIIGPTFLDVFNLAS